MPKRKERTLPKIGSVYQRKYKGKMCTMTVVRHKTAKIGLAYKVGEAIYTSPSGAAKSIVKQEINGWAFWNIK